MDILWCVTGAGQFLEGCMDAASQHAKKHGITLACSKAGYEVLRMYGLSERLALFREVVLEKDQGASAPLVGRLPMKEYGLVVVAPCTANTTAKIACAIADSLVTNIVAQAGKCKVPVYVLPTDAKKTQTTVLPLSVDVAKCGKCDPCVAALKCPHGAFSFRGRPRVDLTKCIGCLECVYACKCKAVDFGREMTIECRDIDVACARKLGEVEGLHVMGGIAQLSSVLK